MSLYMPAGSMPEWSYWAWGLIGLTIFYWSWCTFRYKDPATQRTSYDWENLIGLAIGLFLIYYWLNKIGIVPMYPWQLENWFYKFH